VKREAAKDKRFVSSKIIHHRNLLGEFWRMLAFLVQYLFLRTARALPLPGHLRSVRERDSFNLTRKTVSASGGVSKIVRFIEDERSGIFSSASSTLPFQ